MSYGEIVNRSVHIVWQNKFLILLGILASLGGGSFGGGGGGGAGNGGSSGDLGQFGDMADEFAALALGLLVALVCVIAIVGLVLWAISTIARGGLIAGVDAIESGEKSSFRQAWSAGWGRAGTLLGIGILPALPGLVLFVAGVMALGAYGGIVALVGEELDAITGTAGIGLTLGLLTCIVVPVVLVLSIVRNFAERACMLENLGVIDSYRRGLTVLKGNLGEAVLLFLLQIAIFLVLGIALFIPGIIVVICCFLWPLLLIAQGAGSAFVSSLWTLAWRNWTGKSQILEKSPAEL